MKKQILFAHSGGSQDGPGKGSYDFVKWLQKSLGERYEVLYPIIEDPEAPSWKMWNVMLDKEFSALGDEYILIGHSLGGSMLLKYLSEIESDVKVNGLFLVAAPYWGEDGWDVEEFKFKKDFSKSLPALSSVHLFHCKNDPFVPFEHLKLYQKNLSNAVTHELSGSSHEFAGGLPELVEIIKTCMANNNPQPVTGNS